MLLVNLKQGAFIFMIKSSVGIGRLNKPCDVVVIQLLLNRVLNSKNSSTTKLRVNGISSQQLVNAIIQYQKTQQLKYVDGWIGVKGQTLKRLISDAKVSSSAGRLDLLRKHLKLKSAKPILGSLRLSNTGSLYEKQYRNLDSSNRAGLQSLLTTAKQDKNIRSLPEFAYMLATTKHETASTFRAIEEYGKGAGRPYGKEVTVINPATRKSMQNKYYGRGYVQLTWGYNYQRLDHYLGHGNYPNRFKTKAADYNQGFTVSSPQKSVYLNPSEVLKPDIAYKCMLWGMQGGDFTGVSTSRYIKTNSVDYYNARKVINGLDKASLIASYAEDFEIMLLTASH